MANAIKIIKLLKKQKSKKAKTKTLPSQIRKIILQAKKSPLSIANSVVQYKKISQNNVNVTSL